jgi:ABC-2 type transport system ATP-binding protein
LNSGEASKKRGFFMPVVEVQSLTKSFQVKERALGQNAFIRLFTRPLKRDVIAVNGISFSINQGEQVAFIGPNGAGKSTTLKMLTGILYPTSGVANVLGLTPWDKRQELARHIGIVFGQRSQLWTSLPAIDSFDLLASIYSLDANTYRQRRERIVEMLSIGNLLSMPVRQMSLGQRMRCEIAASLLHAPKVLFLDEPTIGLDVTAKAQLRDHLNAVVREEGVTLMLTSHDTGDIEELCRRVIVINNGQLLLDTDLDRLKRDYLQTKTITLITTDKTPQFAANGVEVVAMEPHKLQVTVDTRIAAITSVVPQLLASLKVEDLVISDPPLEDTIKAIYQRKPGGQK